MNIVLFLILTSFDFITFLRCAEISKLSELKWTLKYSDGKVIAKNISQPCGIYTDLTTTGNLLGDVLRNPNDKSYRSVGESTWIYSINFPYNREHLSVPEKKQEIVFHGLDGIATIKLNGNTLGIAKNSFVRYRYDVTKILIGENDLEITFEGPIKSAKQLAKSSMHDVPPNCVPRSYKGNCHVNFLRRVQASFAWDSVPSIPSVGIWKPVELITYENDLIIRDITVATTLNVDTKAWTITVRIFCDRTKAEVANDISTKMKLTLSLNKGELVEKEFDVTLVAQSSQQELVLREKFEVPNDKVDLWWPNGFGEQPLYKITASFSNNNNPDNEKSIKIGFRTIELVQNDVDLNKPEKGTFFYFKINGRSIFVKGANYLPDSILPEKSGDPDTLKNLLLSAKIVHMNMIRVWGGGRYESDLFYELCDKYGIMIWQDMMFADSMYPVDKQFTDSVSEEVTQQVRRLQHHACIILWNGNDENEKALAKNWYGTNKNQDLYNIEYILFYVNTIKAAVQAIDETRPFLTSSPTNGLKSEQKNYISKDPNDSKYGDTHIYINTSSFLVDKLRMTRFATEYGNQSIASISTLREVASDSDLQSLDSKFMQYRQRSSEGNGPLLNVISNQFGIPSKLKDIIYLSQINQAMLVKIQTEWYRRWRNIVKKSGKGNTMGAMYWQLNDVWPAISWSSIENGGKWKMLHYFARHFFAKVIITADLTSQGIITVHAVSDSRRDIPNAIVQCDIYKWDSMDPIDTFDYKITVKGEKSTFVMSTTVQELFGVYEECQIKRGQLNSISNSRKCFLKLTLQEQNGEKYEVIHENFLFPKEFKEVENMANCDIDVTVTKCEQAKKCVDENNDNCYAKTKCQLEANVKTNGICLFVWLDVGKIPGYFSDNGFTMTENKKLLRFYSPDKVNVNELKIEVSKVDKKFLDDIRTSNKKVSFPQMSKVYFPQISLPNIHSFHKMLSVPSIKRITA